MKLTHVKQKIKLEREEREKEHAEMAQMLEQLQRQNSEIVEQLNVLEQCLDSWPVIILVIDLKYS